MKPGGNLKQVKADKAGGQRKIAYLTIDDSPSSSWKLKLDCLSRHGIPAVWFCEGELLERADGFAEEAIRAGHILGNHSYSHPMFSGLSIEECFEEIRRTDSIIDAVYARIGVDRPAKSFRFPGGDKGGLKYSEVLEPYNGEGAVRKARIQDFLRELGYRQPEVPKITYRWYREAGLLDDVDWYWTYDCSEWVSAEPGPSSGIDPLQYAYDRMEEDVPEKGRGLNYAGSEDIILIHDHDETAALFPLVIDRLVEKGIEFRSVMGRSE